MLDLSRRRAIVLATGAVISTACSGLTGSEKSNRLPVLAPAPPPVQAGMPVGVHFGKILSLDGVTFENDVLKPGDQWRLWLHWRLIGTSSEDCRALCELVGPQGRVFAREDDHIGSRRSRLSRWSVGTRNVDEMRLRVSPSALAGELAVVLSVLRADNQTRVPLDLAGRGFDRLRDDGVVLGTVEIDSQRQA